MPCLLPPAPPPHPCLIGSVSRPPPLPKHRFFLPQTRRRPPCLRLGVPAAESGGESDPIVGGEAPSRPRREASWWAPVEAALNGMSKWLVSGSFAFAAIWKHDPEIMWVLLGAVGNSLLSMVLKKMLNHERPAPTLRSDPGMPSSHAQSIFYATTILVLSLYCWLGTNYLTMILGPATLSVAAYLSWLRVSQRLHTLNQVTVGAVVGTVFGALWFVLWHLVVQEAFASSLLLRIVVILGSPTFYVSFVIYMMSHWLKDG